MKKIFMLLMVAGTAVMFAACGQSSEGTVVATDTVSVDTEVTVETTTVEVDTTTETETVDVDPIDQ